MTATHSVVYGHYMSRNVFIIIYTYVHIHIEINHHQHIIHWLSLWLRLVTGLPILRTLFMR